jgi:hypothetical protein
MHELLYTATAFYCPHQLASTIAFRVLGLMVFCYRNKRLTLKCRIAPHVSS